jgi:hypothetical protein
MSRLSRLVSLCLACFVPLAFAQEKNEGDKLVTVPARYVSADGMKNQSTAEVSKWVGVGREIGVATKEGLSAVVDEANRFGTTKVGTFVMVLVAWKIIGSDLVALVFGLPIYIAGVCVWMWSYRRFFMTGRVLVKYDKAAKIKEYGTRPAYEFQNDEGRAGCAVMHLLSLIAWSIAWMLIIFL